ncbi:MAG: hypothetical protein ACLRSW_01580 [Christensenellaceae bacterium]
MSILEENRIQVGAYCSPQPPCERDGVKYPSKITSEHYRALAELGVTVVYGHAEIIGRDSEKWVYEALQMCAEAGVKYFVRDGIAEEYVSLGFREYPAWKSLAAAERRNSTNGLRKASKSIRIIRRLRDFFLRRAGQRQLRGIAAAKAVFQRICPIRCFTSICCLTIFPPNSCNTVRVRQACLRQPTKCWRLSGATTRDMYILPKSLSRR